MGMTNFRRFESRIIEKLEETPKESLKHGLGLLDNYPVGCWEIPCENCQFREYAKDGKCFAAFMHWLYQEFKEKPIDWTIIETDAPIIITNLDNGKEYRRFFKSYKDGKVYYYMNGRNSWTAEGEDFVPVDRVRLASPKEFEKFRKR